MKGGFFIQEVSGLYTSSFLDTDNLKMALPGPENFPGLSRNGPLVDLYSVGQTQLSQNVEFIMNLILSV